MNKIEYKNIVKDIYESPACQRLTIDACELFCVSTEGYTVHPGKIDEDDWE